MLADLYLSSDMVAMLGKDATAGILQGVSIIENLNLIAHGLKSTISKLGDPIPPISSSARSIGVRSTKRLPRLPS